MTITASVTGPATVDGRNGTIAGTFTGTFTPSPVLPPVPDFGFNPDAVIATGQYPFLNLTGGEVDQPYLWVFGDGTSLETPAPGPGAVFLGPTHTYPAPGTYSVTLVATGPGGTAAVTKDVVVA